MRHSRAAGHGQASRVAHSMVLNHEPAGVVVMGQPALVPVLWIPCVAPDRVRTCRSSKIPFSFSKLQSFAESARKGLNIPSGVCGSVNMLFLPNLASIIF